MDLDEARRLHARWRERLVQAAAGGAPLDTAATADAGQCAFGVWLRGDGRERLGEHAAWRDCVQRHADFHRAAGSIAAAVNRGDAAAARAMLSTGTPFAGAERALQAALDALKAAVALAEAPTLVATPAPAPVTFPAEPPAVPRRPRTPA